MIGLTARQNSCLMFIRQYRQANGIAPSYEEIGRAMNLKAKSGITRLLDALEERGAIRRLKNRARAIEVIDRSAVAISITPDLSEPLARYAEAENISIETAVNQFIRDALEAA